MAGNTYADNKLKSLTLASVYLRSFFIQGAFSEQHRQHIGFAFCMEPVAQEIWGNRPEKWEMLGRHLEYFNGNPFMSPLVLGAVARLEQSKAAGKGTSEQEISSFKKVMGQATGSIGDRIFWSTLRPFGLTAGIFTAYLFGLAGVTVFISLFLLPMLILRWHWLMAGYKLGTGVISELKNKWIEHTVILLQSAGSLILGFFALNRMLVHDTQITLVSAAAFGLFIMSVLLLRSRFPLWATIILAVSSAFTAGIFLGN